MSKEVTITEAFDVNILPENANEGQLRQIAKEKANFICQRIHSLAEKLKEAERLSVDAEYADDDGFFSRKFGSGETATEKRSKLNTQVNTLQNEAIAELANLVQASIQFATVSALLNQAMLDEIAKISNKGFVDVYGDVKQIQDKHEKEYLKQTEDGLKTNQQAHKQGKIVAKNKESIAKNYELISQNQQSIKGVKILAWIAILISLVSLGVSLASKF